MELDGHGTALEVSLKTFVIKRASQIIKAEAVNSKNELTLTPDSYWNVTKYL